jgi:hypothetical protein
VVLPGIAGCLVSGSLVARSYRFHYLYAKGLLLAMLSRQRDGEDSVPALFCASLCWWHFSHYFSLGCFSRSELSMTAEDPPNDFDRLWIRTSGLY